MVASKTNTQDTIQSPFGKVMPRRNLNARSAEGYGLGYKGSLNNDCSLLYLGYEIHNLVPTTKEGVGYKGEFKQKTLYYI